MYPEDTIFPVYCPPCWWSDKWHALSFGRDFDFNKSFFDQYKDLMNVVPRLSMDLVNCENSDFCNYCGDDKNCYFDIAGEGNEDCYYNLFAKYSKNSVDNMYLYNSTLCYECIACHNCYNCNYSTYCYDSSDLFCCYDMRGSRNCFLSFNLRNKEFYIMNEPYTKEEYFKKLAEFNLTSYAARETTLQSWNVFRKSNALHRDMFLTNTENCTGDMITNSKNTFNSFNATGCEDSSYLYDVLDAKDCRDLNYSLYKPELSTELISTLNLTYSAFCVASHYCSSIYYCDMCNNSKNLFGCIAINRGENCILNKQYSAEDYQILKAKIITHMGKDFGEFFPTRLSPHAYNETVAQDFFPLTQENVASKGFAWKEKDLREYQNATTNLPDDITSTSDSLFQEVLACENCSKNYKIIKQELAFYKQQNIPIPRLCADCRHFNRHTACNPRNLFESNCTVCAQQITTTFPPEHDEKVYCENCYQQRLY